MKLFNYLGLSLCFSIVPLALRAQPTVKIVQPYENQKIPAVATSFVFGSVTPATATLHINGTPVTPYRNGGYLTMIPFQEGQFHIEAVATDGISTATFSRSVEVAAAPVSFPPKYPKIEPIAPRTRIVLRPDDFLDVAFQSAPGGTATFRIGGKGDHFPMNEQTSGVAGIYKGVYRIQASDNFENQDITFFLHRNDGKKMTQKAGAQITVQRRAVPRFIELKEKTILLTGPSSELGYSLFLLEGVRLEVTGESGDFYRVSLGKLDEGWIKKSTAVELPAGTPEPRSVSRNIRIEETPTSTILELPLQYRHAHKIEELYDPYRLRLTLYGVVADTDRIRYKSQNTIIKEVAWVQNNADTYTLDVQLKMKAGWGYDVRYEGTKLILEIRRHPLSYAIRGGGLKGLKVAIDAGHSTQNFGTIGPWGNTEASVNLMVAKVVKRELEKHGVIVTMIQDGTKEIGLQERVDTAWTERAQLYISLHCDATDEGVDPRDVQGYSVHYYQPSSRLLADEIHQVYGVKTGIRDQGMWRSNLAVCRITQMPSVLLEMAFLVIPESEEKLLQTFFQQQIADSIVSAIQNFVIKTQP